MGTKRGRSMTRSGSYSRSRSSGAYSWPLTPRMPAFNPNVFTPLSDMIGNNRTSLFTRSGGTSTSGVGVTSQFDRTNVYRRRRMPRYKRRRWVRFLKKTRAALMKDVGTKTVLRNSQLSSSWADDSQRMLTANIYGADGAAATASHCGNDDLVQIFGNDSDLSNQTAKALFGSSVLDITLTNLSTVIEGTQNTGLEVDIYDIVYRKKQDATTFHNLVGVAQTNTGAINGSATQITLDKRGVTFFDFPNLGQMGVKILRKKKYFLGAGECATYQLRDAKNRAFVRQNIDDSDENYIYPGSTRTIAIIVKGVPTNDATKVTKNLVVGVTRKYMYKVMDKNVDLDNII